jgi:arsenate reductase
MTSEQDQPARPLNVLFLCTGNSARSILGEALVNHIGETSGGVARGFSAGSTPVGHVHPVALEVLEARGLAIEGLRSKSWDEFGENENAPRMDVILTVCDNAAAETCPLWPGHPASAHWGLPDPAVLGPEASRDDKLAAFEAIFHILKDRLEQFFGADLAAMSEGERAHLLGQLGGAHHP